MSTFASLRRQAETLERSLDQAVTSHATLSSRLCASLSLSPLDLESSSLSADELRERELSSSIPPLLSSLSSTVASLQATLATPPPPAAAMLLSRFREIAGDHRATFEGASARLAEKRAQRELFGGAAAAGGAGPDPAKEHLLRERGALQSSVAASRGVLGQAGGILGELRGQRGSLGGAAGMAQRMAGSVPGINRVIDGIRRKKQRDNAVLGVVLAGCVLFTLWYWLG
ncbi:hypothetical protein TeGR_g9024 [Tetraparma gracilis]|uniref:Golgi SNAP receptor complex member 1 n=1 Tax=Tetraparma gracilis TaxID=2962635 RepID=A0ABQ6NAS7_9STRA|nr:hypothetical protein TeGR_g9024 [Tetraparma gracilis]